MSGKLWERGLQAASPLVNPKGCDTTRCRFVVGGRSGLKPALLSALALATLCANHGVAEMAVQMVSVAPPVATSRVPGTTAQGCALAPQAVSTVDISNETDFVADLVRRTEESLAKTADKAEKK